MLSSLARGGQGVLARAAQRAAVAAPLSAVRAPAAAAARRSMGGHARHIGLPGEHVPIEVSKVHQTLGTVYLTTMFLWMMYRAKEDGLVLLVCSLSIYVLVPWSSMWVLVPGCSFFFTIWAALNLFYWDNQAALSRPGNLTT